MLFVGHSCPHPDSCSGRLSVPVCHRITGQGMLIAACRQNFGSTAIAPHFERPASVDAASTVCCAFEMHSDDFADEAEWQAAVQAPVRTAVAAFKSKGLVLGPEVSVLAGGPPCHIWRTAFNFTRKSSQQPFPHFSSSAVICYNRVYAIPKTRAHRPSEDWAIVWVSRARADAERQSVLVQEQHGLVRGKSRFGIRVPSQVFEKVFRQLRPDDEPPVRISVSMLFKLGPILASASSDAVSEFLGKIGRRAKVLKMLGPVLLTVPERLRPKGLSTEPAARSPSPDHWWITPASDVQTSADHAERLKALEVSWKPSSRNGCGEA